MSVLYFLMTDFRTQNCERFYDLQLPIASNLSMSLDDYVSEQILQGQNSYRTDIYGLQQARKGLRLSHLPPVLMIQLKRFQFNPYTESNQKILDRCSYPQEIQFSKWTLNQTQTDQYYDLYAVLVHEGTQASSGHYYIVVKLQNLWYKFNDERVQRVSREKALDYNFGGNSHIIEYDSKQMKVVSKEVQNKTTAYMLVYVKRCVKNEFLSNQEPIYPSWLIDQASKKQEMENQKKLRKQSICNISILSWQKHFLNQGCPGFGLFHKDLDQSMDQKIQMVSKSQKIDEWIDQLINQTSQKQLYLYWLSNQKQVLSNIKVRGCNSVNELFKQTYDPMLFYSNTFASREQYLVVIKIFNKNTEPQLTFHTTVVINKVSTISDLYLLLASLHPTQVYNKYYLQEKKLGLIPLSIEDKSLLPTTSPARNQLIIAVIEQLAQNQTSSVLKYYKQEQEIVTVTIKNQATKEEHQRDINKYTTVQQLRDIIFQDILEQQQEYLSSHNIIIKYRPKKNGKNYTEANNDQKLKQLIKMDKQKCIVFSFSNLRTSDRLTFRQLAFSCRDQSLKLQQPIKIIIERNQSQQNILSIIKNNPAVTASLPQRKGYSLRLFLLNKDRNMINDVVDQKGHIISKGQMITVLERDRNALLVVEQYKMAEEETQELVIVLIHHLTRSNQKIGHPRWITIPKTTLLSHLKYSILDLISDQVYEFQGKTYNYNPLKVRILAYVKQISKAIELPQPQTLQQIKQKQIIDVEQEHKQAIQQQISLAKLTIDQQFGKFKFMRIAVVHNYISKGQQALKLNVE